jgi:hypothetical protein
MCFERWTFWLRRLEHLAEEESGLGEETRKVALQAIQIIKEGEKTLASMSLLPDPMTQSPPSVAEH